MERSLALIMGCNDSRLGSYVDIHSVGNDSFADVVKSHLAERNVVLSSPTLADIPTGVCIVLSGPVGGDWWG